MGHPPHPGRPPDTALWSSLARARLEELFAHPDRAPRVAVVGPAGADKSPLLRTIEARLQESRTSRSADAADALHRTLFVDDAHLLTDADVAALDAHLDDAAAGLVLAGRPFPRSDSLRALVRRLEQDAPAIVLGHVDARDVAATLHADGRAVDESCVSSLVALCGSVTWLVKEALVAHGDGPCDDSAHDGVSRALGEIIAERLRTIEPDVAEVIRRASLTGSAATDAPDDGSSCDEHVERAHAEGLLLRNGHAIPVVRAAVLATTPAAQIIALLDDERAGAPGTDVVRSLGDITDPRLARALMAHADRVAASDIGRSLELYAAARAAGADALEVAVHIGRLAWESGEIDEAASFLDATDIRRDHPLHDEAVDLMAGVWSARGFLGVSATTVRAHSVRDPVVRAHGAVAALASGDDGPLREAVGLSPDTESVPTTLSVSTGILLSGLLDSLAATPTGALGELIRASETYSESRYTGPAPELPAVLAAITAVNSGELVAAHTVLGDALMAGQGGAWARPRLLLWSAWVAVHLQLPEEATARLAEVDASVTPLRGREILLRDAVLLAFVRRYGSPGELRPLWERVRDDVRRIEPDLFCIHPLSEFVATAAHFDDTTRFDPTLTTLRGILSQLGDPPLWSAHLLWACFQQAVFGTDWENADELARDLQALPAPSTVIAAMAGAAGEWLSARGEEEVDVERVAAATAELAGAGLAWDAARLAQIAADHATSRKASAQLGALARELHPNVGNSADAPPPRATRDSGVLSARELEVAALVVSGKTYAEIGETIFISPRTAEHHIARIRRRLGATSRADLISKLQAIIDGE